MARHMFSACCTAHAGLLALLLTSLPQSSCMSPPPTPALVPPAGVLPPLLPRAPLSYAHACPSMPLPCLPRRIPAPCPFPPLQFLGDFVDRGAHSLETICLLLALKIEHPNNVHLIRGNHEAADINALFGFRLECLERLGDQQGLKTWQRLNTLFNWLPLAALIEDKVGRREGAAVSGRRVGVVGGWMGLLLLGGAAKRPRWVVGGWLESWLEGGRLQAEAGHLLVWAVPSRSGSYWLFDVCVQGSGRKRPGDSSSSTAPCPRLSSFPHLQPPLHPLRPPACLSRSAGAVHARRHWAQHQQHRAD